MLSLSEHKISLWEWYMVDVVVTLGKMGGAWEVSTVDTRALHRLHVFQAQLESWFINLWRELLATQMWDLLLCSKNQ